MFRVPIYGGWMVNTLTFRSTKNFQVMICIHMNYFLIKKKIHRFYLLISVFHYNFIWIFSKEVNYIQSENGHYHWSLLIIIINISTIMYMYHIPFIESSPSGLRSKPIVISNINNVAFLLYLPFILLFLSINNTSQLGGVPYHLN